jgi:hypothetical protein
VFDLLTEIILTCLSEKDVDSEKIAWCALALAICSERALTPEHAIDIIEGIAKPLPKLPDARICNGCGDIRKIAGRGLCSNCYKYLRRNALISGTWKTITNITKPLPVCKICGGVYAAKGLCAKHYGEKYRAEKVKQ